MLDRRHTPLCAAACLLAALALVAPAAHAQAPPVLVNEQFGFAFPGDFASPANAASAALSLADRWLGPSGFENPAALVPKGVEVSPMFQRVNRQDMAAQHRDYDQVIGYPAFAGARLSMPFGRLGVVAYAWQPVVRFEEYSFSAGQLAQPAFVRTLTAQQELRAGLGVSYPVGAARLGVSGEWVNRDDRYETEEQTGAPMDSTSVIEMKGTGFGATIGISWEKDVDRPWGRWFGAAVRYGSEISLDGNSQKTFIRPGVADSLLDEPFTLARTEEWSGGVSGKVTIAPATCFVAGLSYRQGIDFGSALPPTGSGFSWGGGIDWKDPELSWGARFGVGQETLSDAFEPKAGLFSFGFTWISGDLAIDASILHRNMSREDLPHASDDRAVLSVKVDF